MSGGDPREELARNPFLVLGLPATATRAEVEREGQRLLDALELHVAGADQYRTPFGPRTRGAQELREAMAELRDPERRVLHELFAAPPGDPVPGAGVEPWADALARMGWGRR